MTNLGRLLLVHLMLVVALLAGCRDDSAPTATSTAAPSAAASSSPSASATIEAPEVEPIVQAVLARDDAALVSLVSFVEKPCGTTATGMPGGPVCASGEALGTSVQAFLVSGCPESHYARQPEMPSVFGSFMPAGVHLYAVGIAPSTTAGAGAYTLVFSAPGPVPHGTPSSETVRALDVADGRVVGLSFACPHLTPAEYLQQRNITSFLVPPP